MPWFITRLWNHFEICTEHNNFEIWYTCSSYLCRKSFAIRFSKYLLFFFSRFYVWKFRVNVSFNIVSRRIYSGSLWKPPDADASSVCRESTQILQDRETFSQSMQAPLTFKVKPMLRSTYTFDTNIRWNKIAIYSVRFDVKSKWFDSLLRHFALFHSTAYPCWWVAFPDGECLNYDVPETTL